MTTTRPHERRARELIEMWEDMANQAEAEASDSAYLRGTIDTYRRCARHLREVLENKL